MRHNSFGNPRSPIAHSLERLGEWWSILLVADAVRGLARFDQFCESLGISPNMPTRRLNSLVAAGPAADAHTWHCYTRRAAPPPA